MTTDPAHLGGYIVGGDEHSFTPWLWEKLMEWYRPKSVLDVGCGEGHSTKWFLDRGLDVLGVEGSVVAEDAAAIPWSRFLRHDFTIGPALLTSDYDLCWSCEFVEHVAEEFLGNILEAFKLCRVVAMTAALPWQGGYHHVNCKPQSYWVGHMNRIGFQLDVEHTEESKRVPPEVMKQAYWQISGMIFTRRNG